jgi:protein farnesyltransferase subunit beta
VNRGPDFYHTNYVLLGLSSLQNYFYYVSSSTSLSGEDLPLPLTSPFLWHHKRVIPSREPGTAEAIVQDLPAWPDDAGEGVGDRLRVHHPIFNIPFERVEEIEKWARSRVGF